MEKELKVQQNDIFRKISNHEQVMFCNDPASGLQAIIAIHDTTLGPALGGTRMFPYENVDAALKDALRLADGMTHKCAAAGLDFGGGKAVIIGDPQQGKTPHLLRAFGQYVDSLNGRFYTGTDMGTTVDDFVHVSKETPFIVGIPESYGGSGDSSFPTAQGVIYAMEATNYHLYGHRDLSGRTYAIQGLGKVGFKVAEHLLHAGADLYVTDIQEDVLQEIKAIGESLNRTVHIVKSDDIYKVEADIFVPCAMGGIINQQTSNDLRVNAIVGSANNQLQDETVMEALHKKGILFAPDYIVNAGGLIQVADELYGANKERVLHKTKEIFHSLLDIYEIAEKNGITTTEAANQKCQKTLQEQRDRNNFFSRTTRPKWNIRE